MEEHMAWYITEGGTRTQAFQNTKIKQNDEGTDEGKNTHAKI